MKNKLLLTILILTILLGSAYYFFIFRSSGSEPKPTYIFNPASSSSGYAYVNENKVTGMKIYLGKTDTPKIPQTRFEVKDSWLDFSLGTNEGESGFKKVKPETNDPRPRPARGGQRLETKDHDVIAWENVLSATDLQYNLQDDGLRSEIILKENTLAGKAVKEHELFIIPFYITLNNVVPRSDIEGNLTPLFMDSKTGEYRFHMEKPVLRDSKGAIKDVTWSLKLLDDSSDLKSSIVNLKSVPLRYLLVLELPRVWLYEKDRVYPVTIVSNIIRNTDSAFGGKQ